MMHYMHYIITKLIQDRVGHNYREEGYAPVVVSGVVLVVAADTRTVTDTTTFPRQS